MDGKIDAKKEACLILLKDGRYSDAEISRLFKIPLEDIVKYRKKSSDLVQLLNIVLFLMNGCFHADIIFL